VLNEMGVEKQNDVPMSINFAVNEIRKLVELFSKTYSI